MDHRFTARFIANASIVPSIDGKQLVAKASLEPLKNIFPANIDPEENPDLLYIVFDGALGGYINKNGDGISSSTAVAIYQSSKYKHISVDHDRSSVAGVVIHPALTDLETHALLTEEQAIALNKPFNMSCVGVLWKVVDPIVAGHIQRQGDTTTGSGILSMSWEIAFTEYDIAVGSLNVFEARIIPSEDPSFAVYDKMLFCNGGKGVDDKGQLVGRVIKNDAILLGYSIVPNPAAAVKGILPVEKIEPKTTEAIPAAVPTNEPMAPIIPAAESVQQNAQVVEQQIHETIESVHNVMLNEVTAKLTPAIDELNKVIGILTDKNSEKDQTNQNISSASVTLNTASQIMKIESIEQLEATLGKHEATAAVVDFVKAIKEASDQFSKEIQAKEDLLKNAELAKAENEKRANELAASLETVKKELAEVRAAQEAAEADRRFQDRMTSFDEKFDLDAEDRKLIAADIRDLDDATFEAYSAKCDKLMAAKKKSAKKDGEKPGDKKNDKEPDDDEDDKKAKAAAEAATKAAEIEAAKAKAAVASLQEDKDQTKIPNSVVVDEDLKTRMENAFGNSVLVNGKTVNEHRAAKAAKDKK